MELLDISAVVALQVELTDLWHRCDAALPPEGVLGLVANQHLANFQLWHEEDKARCPSSDDSVIAAVKRKIDVLNQQRNDRIERLDDWLTDQLKAIAPDVLSTAPLNTETPGSAIDRLSILALRMYHLREQLERPEIDDALRQSIAAKLVICQAQHDDLRSSLEQLVCDLFAGRKRHKTYRQFKMYNDPQLNPYLQQFKAPQ